MALEPNEVHKDKKIVEIPTDLPDGELFNWMKVEFTYESKYDGADVGISAWVGRVASKQTEFLIN